jgi:Kef-type K+ transport system membrane component KefB
MQLIITLMFCVFVSFLFKYISKKLNLSVVVGLIVSGVILGSPLLKRIILGPNVDIILKLGNLGFITLMFLAGMEISWCMLYEERKEASVVAFFAAAIPTIGGFLIFFALGFSIFTSLAVGISMGITAEATKARVLLELNKLDTRVGSLMMGAGILDDVFGLLMFGLVIFLFSGEIVTTEFFNVVAAISVFFLGILVHKALGREHHLVTVIEKLLLLLLIPFFFVGMGIHFSFQSLVLDPLLLFGIITIAILGKIGGSLAAKPFTNLSWKQLYLVGWGMNSRGAVELGIAFLALRVGLITEHIYSSLIIMALITTLLFPFMLRRTVKNNPDIMGDTSSCFRE